MPTRRSSAALITLALAAALTGCGGSDEAGGSAAVSEAASVAPADLSEATSADTDLDGEADAGSGLTAEQFCGFLTDEAPKVQDLQPAEYAAATFGSDLFAFYTDAGLLTDIDGADMDALAAEGCPDVAADLLPALGAGSFVELLSS